MKGSFKLDKAKIEQAIHLILEAIGEDPEREGLVDTPKRLAAMYEELFAGLNQDPEELFSVVFSEQHEELVLVKDIPFYSICEHHLIPFFGHAHVAYIPKSGRVTGLSKLARAVEILSKRPQLQERITTTVADAIMSKLDPHGVMIVIEAEHMCMTMRGVKKQGAKTITTAVRGVFAEDANKRGEVLSMIK
jgi:GTP cyclohydrolase IA